MILYSQHFMGFLELTDFVNNNNIPPSNVLKIDADPSNGGWVLWWYA